MTAAQQAEDQRLVDADARLARIAEIEHVYRAKLDAARSANRDDHRFLSGTTHAYTALDRIQRALAGETDPVKLGIADPETQPAPTPEPASLFDEAVAG